jgi:hypothetical protein
MSELRVDDERGSNRLRHASLNGRDVAAILARAVRAHALEDRHRLFELAVSTDPECAVAWLWLAAVTHRESTADARIRTALDLDLGPTAWRDACGELLVAMALRRAAWNAPSACALLIEAQYVKPRDARVWVALATACTTLPMRLSYLERAIELDGVDRDSIRAAILETAIDGSIEMVHEGRMSASCDLLLRATAAAPSDRHLRAVVAKCGALARDGGDHSRPAPSTHGYRDNAWWVRAPLTGHPESPALPEALNALTSYRSSIDKRAGLLKDFASSRMHTALVESAAALTASVDDSSRRPAVAG